MQITAGVTLLVFFAAMSVIGIVSAKKVNGMGSFLLGGRKIGAWMSAFSYGTAYFSAVVFIGYAGNTGWNIGIAGVWVGVGNALIGSLAAWLLLAKRTRAMTKELGASTMPEFFSARYKSTAMKIYSAAIIFVFLVPYAASVYKGLGYLFGAVFPFLAANPLNISPEIICMFIVALISAVYLVLGGYIATTAADFFQGIIMLVGVFTLAGAIAFNPLVGGPLKALGDLAKISPNLAHPFGGENWPLLLATVMLTSLGTWGLPQMIHKFYAIEDEGKVAKATVVSTLFAFIIGGGAYFIGSFGRVYLGNALPAAGYDAVVPDMLMRALGGGAFTNIVLSVVLLLLLAGSLSTLTAIVLTSGSSIAVDLLGVIKPDYDKKRQMRLMRILCLLFIAASFIFAAMRLSFITTFISFSWGVVSGCFIGPYVWGLYSKKITRAGAWAGMLSGVAVVGGGVLYKIIAGGPDVRAGFTAAAKISPYLGVFAMLLSLAAVPAVSALERACSSLAGGRQAEEGAR